MQEFMRGKIGRAASLGVMILVVTKIIKTENFGLTESRVAVTELQLGEQMIKIAILKKTVYISPMYYNTNIWIFFYMFFSLECFY